MKKSNEIVIPLGIVISISLFFRLFLFPVISPIPEPPDDADYLFLFTSIIAIGTVVSSILSLAIIKPRKKMNIPKKEIDEAKEQFKGRALHYLNEIVFLITGGFLFNSIWSLIEHSLNISELDTFQINWLMTIIIICIIIMSLYFLILFMRYLRKRYKIKKQIKLE